MILDQARGRFRTLYREMLEGVGRAARPTAVCTIYDAIPDLGPAERTALAGFNEIILREAFRVGIPVIDLRQVCGQAADFSTISSIEPSVTGGAKIARAIVEAVTGPAHYSGRSVIIT
jgi:hypothetical protein